MKQLLLISIVLVLLSGCVSNSAYRAQQSQLEQAEEVLAQNNEELVVLRKEIMQSRRTPGSASDVLDPEYIQNQFSQNETDMKSLIQEVAQMAFTLDSLGENVVSSDREIVNMIRALEARIAALGNEELSPEQMAALSSDTKLVEANAKEIDTMQAELSYLKQQVKNLQASKMQSTAQDTQLQESSSGEKAEYEAARDVYYTGNFSQAISKLDAFVAKYPKSIYSGNAIYWKGESYYAQGEFNAAMREFNSVITNHKDSWKVADSQLKLGMCQMNMGNHQAARTELNKLKQNHPGYSRMDIADKLLQQLQ